MKKFLNAAVVSLLALTICPPLSAQNYDKEIKKLEFEVSGGLAPIHQHDIFYSRIYGISSFIDQYADFYQLTVETTGDEVKKIDKLIPLNLSLNYNFSPTWCLKIGFEYSSGKAFTARDHTVNWTDTAETHNYRYDYRLSSLMPYVGVESRFSSFGVYANIGFNITDFSFTQDFEYAEGANRVTTQDTYDVKGKAAAVTIGGKYMIKLGNKARLFLKIEYLYLKINSFAGEKKSSVETSTGPNLSESVEGTIYSYEINPYGSGWFEFWDLYAAEPENRELRNISKMGLDLSCIRVMIGFSF
ncbi:MAG: outer membrane beta-barrel protein [Candidatus Aminicenantes bacterium]|nr:outer membrane beta-barrel protein [Candidatus Aminicenantes bacterium]